MALVPANAKDVCPIFCNNKVSTVHIFDSFGRPSEKRVLVGGVMYVHKWIYPADPPDPSYGKHTIQYYTETV